MLWNKGVQRLAEVSPRRGVFARFLRPVPETHQDLFGKYTFQMDLSLGWLQKILFLKPENYEAETQEALRVLIKPGMTVLDIGANTGYFTVLMADLVGPTGRLYSFEPFAANLRLLKDNVKANHLSWVQVIPVALSDHEGTAILHINPVNDGGHSLGDSGTNSDMAGWDRAALQETVATETLDGFLEKNGVARVDVIKIDVEGAETLVFAGASKLLSRVDAPVLLCEVGTIAQSQVGKTEGELRDLLYSHDYRSFWLKGRHEEFDRTVPVKGLENVLFSKRKIDFPHD
jgi:FkbM family methyltransferase